MPELPEVETTRLSLLAGVEGKRIEKLELRRGDLRVPFSQHFAKRVAGRRVEAIRRRAKYLLFDLDSGETIIAHLGMSGSFRLAPAKGYRPRTHDHALFHLEGGRLLAFHDPRRFGLLLLEKTKDIQSHALFAHLGPEPLEKAFSPAYLEAALGKRKGPIKPTLMDQQLVVGVGNIYASESLFLAGIHPATPSHHVAGDAKRLIAAIQKTLRAALKSGGSTLRDFSGGDGEAGYFQHHFNTYGRRGQPCVACGHAIEEITQGGRATFFCPHCQKKESRRDETRGKKTKK